ncbi:MAG TPA: hypothetical protein P5556_06580 [Candidatus Gastranaerophilales bacterium]|nr:hypothetical protein [Candidatus Gastranaerophilales bacterium]
MTTINNCRVVCQEAVIEKEHSREDLCKKICDNILQGLLEGYEELKEKNPEKTENFQSQIEEIKKQLVENQIKQSIETVFSAK